MPLYTFDGLISNPPAQQPSLIGNMLLPECGSLFIVAETGVGKSAIALDLAMCLVLGKHLWNAIRQRTADKGKPFFPVYRCCRVLYLDTELGPVGCYDRCTKLKERYTQGMEVGDMFHIVSGDSARMLLHNKGGDSTNYLANLEKLIEQTKPDVVFFDPLAQFHEVDENTNAMNSVLGNLKHLQHKHKFASVILHHESDKEFITSREGIIKKPATTARARGHSSIAAWTDTMLLVHSEKKEAEKFGIISLNWAKVRHARKPRQSFLLADIGKMCFEWVCADNAPNHNKRKSEALEAYRKANYPEEELDDVGDI